MEKELDKDNLEAVKERQFAIAKTCVRMAYMLKEYDFRISKICGLTAFSLDTTFESLNLVNRLYWTVKNTTATSDESRINPATLYEIERLLQPLRPNVLDPEYTWKKIIPLCKKYKAERDVLLKESSQYVPVLSDPAESVKYFKRLNNSTDSLIENCVRSSSSVSSVVSNKPIAVDIDHLLGQHFPREVLKGESMDEFTMKDLDKTINDLKKSINQETEYRKKLQLAGLPDTKLVEKKSRSQTVKKDPSVKRERWTKVANMNSQTVPNIKVNTSNQQQLNTDFATSLWQNSQSHLQIESDSKRVGPPEAHSNVSTPFSPTISHLGSPTLRVPPVAHSNHPPQYPGNSLAPQPTGASQFHSHLYSKSNSSDQFSQKYSSSQKCGEVKVGIVSSTMSQATHVHVSASDVLKQSLCNKIQSSMLHKSHRSSVSALSRSSSGLLKQNNATCSVTTAPNEKRSYTLEYSTASSSPAECARIAQQIAEMHLKQRAERERLESKKPKKPKPKKESPKTSLTSKSIPSRSQISELLSQTMKGTAENTVERNVQNIIHIRNKILQATNVASSNSEAKQPSSQKVQDVTGSSKLQIATDQPGEVKSQKFYLTTASVIDKLKKDKAGVVNLSDSKGFSVKPVFSMVVPRSLTNPDNQEELVRRVTNMVKKATSSRDSSMLSSTKSVISPQVHLHVNQTENNVKGGKPKNSQISDQEVKSTPVPDHVLEFLKNRYQSDQSSALRKEEVSNSGQNISVSVVGQSGSNGSLQNMTQSSGLLSSGNFPVHTQSVMSVCQADENNAINSSMSQITAQAGIAVPQSHSGLNMLATVASNSIAHCEQQMQNKMSVSSESQKMVTEGSSITAAGLISSYNQPPQNFFQSMSQQSSSSQQTQRIPLRQQPIQQEQAVLMPQSLSQTGTTNISPNNENRIRLPVTSEQQRFMHVFDQFGNKQIVNMTPQTHLLQQSRVQNNPISQFQSVFGIQNSVTPQATKNATVINAASGFPSVLQNTSDITQQSIINRSQSSNIGSQLQSGLLTMSDNEMTMTPQTVAAVNRQQFNIVPELSPAVVQQILTDLMRTGSQQDTPNSSFSRGISASTQQGLQKREIFLFPKKDSIENTKKVIQKISGNVVDDSVLETKHIPNLEKSALETKAIPTSTLKTIQPKQSVQVCGNTVATLTAGNVVQSNVYQSVSIQNTSLNSLRLLNSLDATNKFNVGTSLSTRQIQSLNTPSPSAIPDREFNTQAAISVTSNSVPLTLPHTSIADQLMQVPDLPDLGRKEFGIDELLCTDSSADLSDQKPDMSEGSSKREHTVLKCNAIIPSENSIDVKEIGKVQQRLNASKKIESGQDILQIESDQEMIKHVDSLFKAPNKGTTNVPQETSNILGNDRKPSETNRTEMSQKECEMSASMQNKTKSGLSSSHYTQVCQNKEIPQDISPKVSSQQEQSQSKISPSHSTFYNAARLAKEREERERNNKNKQDKVSGLQQNTQKTIHGCSICFKTFESLETLREHVKLNLCPSKTCTICDRVFPSLEQLRTHLKVPCKGSKEKIKDFEYTKIYVCSKCNFTSQNEKIGTKHVENCNVSSSPVKAKVTIWFKCHMCREVLHDKDVAYKHISKFCPQLKAVKAMQDAQKTIDKMRNKPDSSYKDPKIFIQDCFLYEKSKVPVEANAAEIGKGQLASVCTKEKQVGSLEPSLNNKTDSQLGSKFLDKEDTTEAVKEKLIDSVTKAADQIEEISNKHQMSCKSSEQSSVVVKQIFKADSVNIIKEENVSRKKTENLLLKETKEKAVRKNAFGIIKEETISRNKTENLHLKEIEEKVVKNETGVANEQNQPEIVKENKSRKSKSLVGRSASCQVPQADSRKQRVESLRNKRLIKRKAFFDEETSRKPVPSLKIKKDKKAAINESTSACKLCLYSTKVERSLARHYTQAHDFGFKLQNKRYRCKYCDVSFQSSSKIMIKGHMMKHAEILLKQVAKSKHLNRSHPHLTPEKIDNSSQAKTLDYSPRRIEKVKKHLKARAARSKCAENLRKIAFTQKPCSVREKWENLNRRSKDGKEEIKHFCEKNTDTNVKNSESETPAAVKTIKGRPRKYPVGKEPYRLYKDFYSIKKHKAPLDQQKHKLSSGADIQTHRSMKRSTRSRSSSVGSNTSMSEYVHKTRSSRPRSDYKIEQTNRCLESDSNITRDLAHDTGLKIPTRSQAENIKFGKPRMCFQNDMQKKQVNLGAEKKLVSKENSVKMCLSTNENADIRVKNLRPKRNTTNVSSGSDTSGSDSDPVIPIRERLRKRKEFGELVIEDSRATTTAKQITENRISEKCSHVVKANEQAMEGGTCLVCYDVEVETQQEILYAVENESNKRKSLGKKNDLLQKGDVHLGSSDAAIDLKRFLRSRSIKEDRVVDCDKIEQVVDKKIHLRKSREKQRAAVANNDASDHDTIYTFPLNKRLRKRSKLDELPQQEYKTDDNEGNKTSKDTVERKRLLQIRKSPEIFIPSDTDDDSSEDSDCTSPLRKRLRRRSNLGDMQKQESNKNERKEQQHKNKNKKEISELKRAFRLRQNLKVHADSDADDDASDSDSSSLVPLRKRLRKRGNLDESQKLEPNKKTDKCATLEKNNKDSSKLEENKRDTRKSNYRSKLLADSGKEKSHRTTDASQSIMQIEVSSFGVSQSCCDPSKSQLDKKKDFVIHITDSQATESENDSGRATPIKERLRERKSFSEVQKETSMQESSNKQVEAPDTENGSNENLPQDKTKKARTDFELHNSGFKRYMLRGGDKSNQRGRDESFEGDCQASLDIIFDVLEKECETLAAPILFKGNQDEASVFSKNSPDAEIKTDTSKEKFGVKAATKRDTDKKQEDPDLKALAVQKTNQLCQKRSFLENGSKEKTAVERKEKNDSDNETKPLKGQKSLSVLLGPDDDYSNPALLLEKASLSKEDENKNRAIDEAESHKTSVILENEDEFLCLMPNSLVPVNETKHGTAMSAKSTSSSMQIVKNKTENFDSEFFKFTQKRQMNDSLSSSGSDSDLEQKINTEVKKQASKRPKNTTVIEEQEKQVHSMPVAPAEYSTDSKMTDTVSEKSQNVLTTRNFDEVFQAFAGVGNSNGADKKNRKDIEIRLASPVMTTGQERNISTKAENASTQMRKNADFVGAFKDFFMKTSHDKNKKQISKQIALTQSETKSDPGNKNVKRVKRTEMKAFHENLLQCNVHVNRLSDKEIEKYKKYESCRGSLLEAANKHFDVIILDSDEENSDDIELIDLSNCSHVNKANADSSEENSSTEHTTKENQISPEVCFLELEPESSKCIEKNIEEIQPVSKEISPDLLKITCDKINSELDDGQDNLKSILNDCTINTNHSTDRVYTRSLDRIPQMETNKIVDGPHGYTRKNINSTVRQSNGNLEHEIDSKNVVMHETSDGIIKSVFNSDEHSSIAEGLNLHQSKMDKVRIQVEIQNAIPATVEKIAVPADAVPAYLCAGYEDTINSKSSNKNLSEGHSEMPQVTEYEFKSCIRTVNTHPEFWKMKKNSSSERQTVEHKEADVGSSDTKISPQTLESITKTESIPATTDESKKAACNYINREKIVDEHDIRNSSINSLYCNAKEAGNIEDNLVHDSTSRLVSVNNLTCSGVEVIASNANSNGNKIEDSAMIKDFQSELPETSKVKGIPTILPNILASNIQYYARKHNDSGKDYFTKTLDLCESACTPYDLSDKPTAALKQVNLDNLTPVTNLGVPSSVINNEHSVCTLTYEEAKIDNKSHTILKLNRFEDAKISGINKDAEISGINETVKINETAKNTFVNVEGHTMSDGTNKGLTDFENTEAKTEILNVSNSDKYHPVNDRVEAEPRVVEERNQLDKNGIYPKCVAKSSNQNLEECICISSLEQKQPNLQNIANQEELSGTDFESESCLTNKAKENPEETKIVDYQKKGSDKAKHVSYCTENLEGDVINSFSCDSDTGVSAGKMSPADEHNKKVVLVSELALPQIVVNSLHNRTMDFSVQSNITSTLKMEPWGKNDIKEDVLIVNKTSERNILTSEFETCSSGQIKSQIFINHDDYSVDSYKNVIDSFEDAYSQTDQSSNHQVQTSNCLSLNVTSVQSTDEKYSVEVIQNIDKLKSLHDCLNIDSLNQLLLHEKEYEELQVEQYSGSLRQGHSMQNEDGKPMNLDKSNNEKACSSVQRKNTYIFRCKEDSAESESGATFEGNFPDQGSFASRNSLTTTAPLNDTQSLLPVESDKYSLFKGMENSLESFEKSNIVPNRIITECCNDEPTRLKHTGKKSSEGLKETIMVSDNYKHVCNSLNDKEITSTDYKPNQQMTQAISDIMDEELSNNFLGSLPNGNLMSKLSAPDPVDKTYAKKVNGTEKDHCIIEELQESLYNIPDVIRGIIRVDESKEKRSSKQLAKEQAENVKLHPQSMIVYNKNVSQAEESSVMCEGLKSVQDKKMDTKSVNQSGGLMQGSEGCLEYKTCERVPQTDNTKNIDTTVIKMENNCIIGNKKEAKTVKLDDNKAQQMTVEENTENCSFLTDQDNMCALQSLDNDNGNGCCQDTIHKFDDCENKEVIQLKDHGTAAVPKAEIGALDEKDSANRNSSEILKKNDLQMGGEEDERVNFLKVCIVSKDSDKKVQQYETNHNAVIQVSAISQIKKDQVMTAVPESDIRDLAENDTWDLESLATPEDRVLQTEGVNFLKISIVSKDSNEEIQQQGANQNAEVQVSGTSQISQEESQRSYRIDLEHGDRFSDAKNERQLLQNCAFKSSVSYIDNTLETDMNVELHEVAPQMNNLEAKSGVHFESLTSGLDEEACQKEFLDLYKNSCNVHKEVNETVEDAVLSVDYTETIADNTQQSNVPVYDVIETRHDACHESLNNTLESTGTIVTVRSMDNVDSFNSVSDDGHHVTKTSNMQECELCKQEGLTDPLEEVGELAVTAGTTQEINSPDKLQRYHLKPNALGIVEKIICLDYSSDTGDFSNTENDTQKGTYWTTDVNQLELSCQVTYKESTEDCTNNMIIATLDKKNKTTIQHNVPESAVSAVESKADAHKTTVKTTDLKHENNKKFLEAPDIQTEEIITRANVTIGSLFKDSKESRSEQPQTLDSLHDEKRIGSVLSEKSTKGHLLEGICSNFDEKNSSNKAESQAIPSHVKERKENTCSFESKNVSDKIEKSVHKHTGSDGLSTNKQESSVETKRKTCVKLNALEADLEGLNGTEMEEFKKRTESVKQSLKRSKGKPYECDFNFDVDNDASNICSNSSCGIYLGSHCLESDSFKVTAEPLGTASPFVGTEACSSPRKNTVSTMTCRIGSRKTYCNRNNIVSKDFSDKMKKYSKKTSQKTFSDEQVTISKSVNEIPDRYLLPSNTNSERKTLLPKIDLAKSQFTKMSLPLRDDPESPRSVSSDSASGTESNELGMRDVDDKTLHVLKEFRKLHQNEMPFTWEVDSINSSDSKLRDEVEEGKSRVDRKKTGTVYARSSEDESILRPNRRKLSHNEAECLKRVDGKATDDKNNESVMSTMSVRRLRSPNISEPLLQTGTGNSNAQKNTINKDGRFQKAESKNGQTEGTVKEANGPNSLSHNPCVTRVGRRKSTGLLEIHGSKASVSTGKSAYEKHIKLSTKTAIRSSSINTLSINSRNYTAYLPGNLPTDVDGSVITDTQTKVEACLRKSCAPVRRNRESSRLESVKTVATKGVKRKSSVIKIANINELENDQKVHRHDNNEDLVNESITNLASLNKELQQPSDIESSDESEAKQVAIDSCKNVEQREKIQIRACKCANTCEKCQKKQNDYSTKVLKVAYRCKKPAVRRLIHGGKVFEIQKGSITETDYASINTGTTPKSCEISPQPAGSRMKTRLLNMNIAELSSPKSKKAKIIKSEENVEGLETSLFVKTGADLNKYIHATLKQIRKQRQQKDSKQSKEPEMDTKWKVTRKDQNDKYPYSFKRSRPIT